MNLNEYPEELKNEEQFALDKLIAKMDRVLNSLDHRMKEYVREAKNADISLNPDLYLSQLMAQKGIKDTAEYREKLLQSRDELYRSRLLLKYNDGTEEGIREIKVGLHSCSYGSKKYVVSWTMPVCRHYLFDNNNTDFESIVKDKDGKEYHTKYSLLIKNEVTLRFTRVKKVINMFPGVFNDTDLEKIKNTGFFSNDFIEKMISRFNPDEYKPDQAAEIISDEFLQELLQRRSSPEFRNIVFSIQKKQGEIIQAPYERNLIVQGCAGSGKSMIMLHRLPILLYDNPNSFSRTSLYIISPSQTYTQLADNMRHQLEISDINMGTIEQYYDYCIEKYPGYKASEYGRISYSDKLNSEQEAYIYSKKCISDIKQHFEGILNSKLSLKPAFSELGIHENERRNITTYYQKINYRLLLLQSALTANENVIERYFVCIQAVVDSLKDLSATLRYRKLKTIQALSNRINSFEKEIERAQIELKKLDENKNADAIKNRLNIIHYNREHLEQTIEEKSIAELDDDYFNSLNLLNDKVEAVIDPFQGLNKGFTQNTIESVYHAVGLVGQLIGGFYMLSWEISKIEDKYSGYLGAISQDVDKTQQEIKRLQERNEKYLDLEYYNRIQEEHNALSEESKKAVKNAYRIVMANIGIESDEKGNIKALKCSPYVYLQILFQYRGISSMQKESLLAIDEAQGIAPEELNLLKNVNGGNVIFNLYGDINQHIEGSKGINSWEEYSDIIDFDIQEMKENYRNASQITNYCNRFFNMDMVPINTSGKGVHELSNIFEFRTELHNQLFDNKRTGLAAILVGNDAEARYLMGEYSEYENKFHDMTGEDFGIHRTRWNIIHIDDAKGLEFSSVIVLAGRMSRNQKYIAFTRALDDLYVYSEVIDVTGYEKKVQNKQQNNNEQSITKPVIVHIDYANASNCKKQKKESKKKEYKDSELRKFFEKSGLDVVDKRDKVGGRLWVIGEKTAIKSVINAAMSKFQISGKYISSSKEIGNRNGWCTKSDK
ncbi:hypothetical protein [[Clostridium] aminophilum]|uniref:hypothetical protein n=1 Tax=[Clostridium] aminophilum TaxID=1526 RepID=UPI003333C1C7